jgi:hypothetical protein
MIMKTKYLGALLCAMLISQPAAAATVAKWKWLKGTTWYVPTNNLPAYIYYPSKNRLVPVSDQTVYTITGYRNGYFWGRTAAQLGDNEINCMSLVGSVTPEGKVYLTFTAYPYSRGDESTTGFGTMVSKNGQWTMENQMSTGSASAQVGHWAYMVQALPNSAAWNSLPGVDMSVPEFMESCRDAAPQVPN